ncbi:hypothetical protein JTE90_010334 [Oedothorax gibbosus]|uniref:PH domain-containing protein n=1 Tax=Oedothorax gibbosus TaxID=931172 RepID=A0AAV6TQ43_9ARAC|nr:hypothetical protein JTE90_010334 [Oedothorax gibbosus]
MDNSVIAKSGWLTRQTTVMKKWKKSWVELYRDGHLKYYENECSPNAEEIIFMPSECLAIKTGLQVESVQPPEGYGIQNLISVISTTGKNWIFCGESLDDVRAWQLAMEQARLFGLYPHLSGSSSAYLPPYNPGYLPTYSGDSLTYLPQFPYPHPAYYGYPAPQYMATSGQTSMIYQPERYRTEGADIGLGMLGNSTAGSLLWSPLLWW